MPLKLRVMNEAVEESDPAEYFFERERITIGRGSDNHLTLPDRKRIVSTKHAEVRQEGNTYQLVDLGSKNFTYLRDQRLQAQQPYELHSGDVFRIGDFEIEFVPIEAPEPAAEETVFAADFRNPFEEPANDLMEALEGIIEAYEEETPQRRADAMQDAFRHATEEMGEHEAVQRVFALLGGDTKGSRPEKTETSPASSADTSSAPAASSTAPASSASKPERQRAPTVEAPHAAVDAVLNTLLQSISQIIGIPWQFRHEFIGQTIMQSADTAFLYEGDAEALKEHLLDPSLSEDERQERLEKVEEAAESLVVHQVAMLNGYKASVMKGAQELMEQLNPEAVEAELAESNKLYDLMPVLASPVVVERLRAKWNELQMGDGSVAEQRVFRPAFIKAYLARMTAVRSSDKDTH